MTHVALHGSNLEKLMGMKVGSGSNQTLTGECDHFLKTLRTSGVVGVGYVNDEPVFLTYKLIPNPNPNPLTR